MKPERCQAVAKSGKPCSALARPGKRFCLWHDPEAAGERRDLSRKGGQSRSNLARLKRALPTEPLSFAELQGVLGACLRDLLTGKLDPSVANSAATLARAYASAAQVGELEERLRDVEARAGLREVS